MDKRYYIFFAVTAIFSLLLGGFLTAFFYSSRSKDVGESLKDFSLGSGGEEVELLSSSSDDCDFFVDVSGAVMDPKVVCVQEGAIVMDALKKAGDFNPHSYAFKYVAQKINLAQKLEPGEKVYIPFHDDVLCTFVQSPQVSRVSEVMEEIGISDPGGKSLIPIEKSIEGEKVQKGDEKKTIPCVNINEASQSELTSLVGIGDSRARDIIEGRPYSKIEDIKQVSGIGDVTFSNIKDFICI